jgi:hypothetical protein
LKLIFTSAFAVCNICARQHTPAQRTSLYANAEGFQGRHRILNNIFEHFTRGVLSITRVLGAVRGSQEEAHYVGDERKRKVACEREREESTWGQG